MTVILGYTNSSSKVFASPLVFVKFLMNSRPNSSQGSRTPVYHPHLNTFSSPHSSHTAIGNFTLLCGRVLCTYFIHFLFDCNLFEDRFYVAYTNHHVGTNWLN